MISWSLLSLSMENPCSHLQPSTLSLGIHQRMVKEVRTFVSQCTSSVSCRVECPLNGKQFAFSVQKMPSACWASSLSWIVPFLSRAIDILKFPCEVVWTRKGVQRTLDCLGWHCSLCPLEQSSILFPECPGWQIPYVGFAAPFFRELSYRSAPFPRIHCRAPS